MFSITKTILTIVIFVHDIYQPAGSGGGVMMRKVKLVLCHHFLTKAEPGVEIFSQTGFVGLLSDDTLCLARGSIYPDHCEGDQIFLQ